MPFGASGNSCTRTFIHSSVGLRISDFSSVFLAFYHYVTDDVSAKRLAYPFTYNPGPDVVSFLIPGNEHAFVIPLPIASDHLTLGSTI